jgi:hypothetical protein
MDWTKDSNKGTEYFSSTAEDISQLAAIRETLSFFTNTILPKNRDLGCDYVRIELWLDSGRLIIFPALNNTEDRVEKSGCQLVIPSLLESYDSIADSEVSDEQFDKEVAVLEEEICDQIEAIIKEYGQDKTAFAVWSSGRESFIRQIGFNRPIS